MAGYKLQPDIDFYIKADGNRWIIGDGLLIAVVHQSPFLYEDIVIM